MLSEEPVIFEPIVLDLAVASHVDHPALTNPFPVSVREGVRGERDGWLVEFCWVELSVRRFRGVGKSEGGRIPWQEGKVRIVGNRKHGYPRNEAESKSEMGADRYDVTLGGEEEVQRVPK
jgi:hypothetical protein